MGVKGTSLVDSLIQKMAHNVLQGSILAGEIVTRSYFVKRSANFDRFEEKFSYS